MSLIRVVTCVALLSLSALIAHAEESDNEVRVRWLDEETYRECDSLSDIRIGAQFCHYYGDSDSQHEREWLDRIEEAVIKYVATHTIDVYLFSLIPPGHAPEKRAEEESSKRQWPFSVTAYLDRVGGRHSIQIGSHPDHLPHNGKTEFISDFHLRHVKKPLGLRIAKQDSTSFYKGGRQAGFMIRPIVDLPLGLEVTARVGVDTTYGTFGFLQLEIPWEKLPIR